MFIQTLTVPYKSPVSVVEIHITGCMFEISIYAVYVRAQYYGLLQLCVFETKFRGHATAHSKTKQDHPSVCCKKKQDHLQEEVQPSIHTLFVCATTLQLVVCNHAQICQVPS